MSNKIKQLEQLEAHEHRLSLAMESLIKISDAAMESLQIGGIHPQSYSFLQTSLAGPMQLAGFNQPVTSSLESFALGRNRLMATQVSLEGISEVLKKIWEMIVDAAQRIWQWVRTNLGKVVSNLDLRIAQVQKLRVSLATRGDLNVSDDIEIAAEDCYVSGERVEARALIDAMSQIADLTRAAVEFDKSYLELTNEQVKAFEGPLKKDGDVETLQSAVRKKQSVELPSQFKVAKIDHDGQRVNRLKGSMSVDDFENARIYSTEAVLKLEAVVDVAVYSDDNGTQLIKAVFNSPERIDSWGFKKKKLKLFSKGDIEKLLTAIEKSATSKSDLEELAGAYDSAYTHLKAAQFKAGLQNAADDRNSTEVKTLIHSLGKRVGRPPLSAKVAALQHDLIGQALFIARLSINRYD